MVNMTNDVSNERLESRMLLRRGVQAACRLEGAPPLVDETHSDEETPSPRSRTAEGRPDSSISDGCASLGCRHDDSCCCGWSVCHRSGISALCGTLDPRAADVRDNGRLSTRILGHRRCQDPS